MSNFIQIDVRSDEISLWGLTVQNSGANGGPAGEMVDMHDGFEKMAKTRPHKSGYKTRGRF